MAVSYDQIYNEEYTKNLGNSVKSLEAAQAQGETSLKKTYDASAQKLLSNRNKALQEAYISRMMAQRDAPAQLARQGLGGGYSETNQASITRNYQNNRRAAETDYADNRTTLDTGYNGDLSNLKSSYADAIMSAKQNAISLALSSAAQRYNALQAEEAAASASGSGSAGGYSAPAQSAVKQSSNTGYNGYGATKGYTGTRYETRNGRMYRVTYENGLQTGQIYLGQSNSKTGMQ